MRDVASVDQEIRLRRRVVIFRDGFGQSGGDVFVSVLVETDMAVAYLNKAESARRGFQIMLLAKHPRNRNSRGHGPEQTGARPLHALQKAAPVDTIIVFVV